MSSKRNKAEEHVYEDVEVDRPEDNPENYPLLEITEEILSGKNVKEHSKMDAFVWDVLEGSDKFKGFVTKYVHEFVKINPNDSDLNYFDWLFHQHLRDSFLEYARIVLDETQKGEGEFVDEMINKYGSDKLENVVFMDIFQVITSKNGDKNIGKFLLNKMEKK